MTFWPTFWGVLLLLSVGGFLVLAVAVTIGGFRDAFAMFRRLESNHEDVTTPPEE